MSEIKAMNLTEFVNEGYLQELNRRFLHPLGLALEVVVDESKQPMHFGRVWDFRDDPEGIIYGSDTIDAQKAENISQIENDRRTDRTIALGYWVQPVDE